MIQRQKTANNAGRCKSSCTVTMAAPLPVLARNSNPTLRSRPLKRTGYGNGPATLREADANKIEFELDVSMSKKMKTRAKDSAVK